MLTADININEFNRGMNRLINRVGLDARGVMTKELMELTKTLVKISPPSDRNKSMKDAKAQISSRFEKLGGQNNSFDSSAIQEGNNGLKYWASSSKYLFAGAADSDMTKANTDELRAVYYRSKKVQGSYRIVVPFRNPRRQQQVAITTRIMATSKQVKAVGDRIAKNFGRLKAGWLGPVIAGAVNIAGKFAVPKWVNDHRNGARAKFINNLRTPNNPNFTIINFAKGVTSKSSKFFVDKALRIRAKAMKKNAEMILQGKKEYAY